MSYKLYACTYLFPTLSHLTFPFFLKTKDFITEKKIYVSGEINM